MTTNQKNVDIEIKEKEIKEDIKKYREIKDVIIDNIQEHINIANKTKVLSDKITNTILMIKECYKSDGKPIFIGNGGSAADCQHIVAEFIGIGLPAIALTTNTSILTALGNDFGYENVFSRQLESIATEKDLLIAYSTSGNSPNVLSCIESAKNKSIRTIAITGRGGGKIKNLMTNKDILINIPSEDVTRIQEMTITIGHIIFEKIKNWE